MSQFVTVDSLMEAFFEARRHNLQPIVAQAEAAEQFQLAKVFRAVIVSDNHRDRLMRAHLLKHTTLTNDYYVCPQCGLIFEPEAPEICPVDETPGTQFERIE